MRCAIGATASSKANACGSKTKTQAQRGNEGLPFSYVDALRTALDGIQCPVLFDLDIGHIAPQLSLVNGAKALVSFSDGAGSVVQRLGSKP